MSKLVILSNREDFEQFKKSRAYGSSLMRLRVVPSNQNYPRFGFIIPKKTLPLGSDRNKIRRRLKAILTSNLGNLKAKDVLIFPNKAALKQKYSELNQGAIQLFKQAGLWKS